MQKNKEDKPLEERTDPGSYRKRIYAYLEEQGFKIVDKSERHKMLSFLIKANANSLTQVWMQKHADMTALLHRREKAMGVRSKTTSMPIFCTTKEEHITKACYFECKV